MSSSPVPSQAGRFLWHRLALSSNWHPFTHCFSILAPRSHRNLPRAGHLLRALSRDTKPSFPRGTANINSSSKRSTQGSESFSLNFPLWLTNQSRNSKNNWELTAVHQTPSWSPKDDSSLHHYPAAGHTPMPSVADVRATRAVQTVGNRRSSCQELS